MVYMLLGTCVAEAKLLLVKTQKFQQSLVLRVKGMGFATIRGLAVLYCYSSAFWGVTGGEALTRAEGRRVREGMKAHTGESMALLAPVKWWFCDPVNQFTELSMELNYKRKKQITDQWFNYVLLWLLLLLLQLPLCPTLTFFSFWFILHVNLFI